MMRSKGEEKNITRRNTCKQCAFVNKKTFREDDVLK